ncbi:hypothetical protein [Kriegella aquimaris]|uniref:Polysaccharide lyase n=1 Tax=Kriegella aquimaris TaxID=192904 RepID=A0A1G9WXC3_9FLAO|nr:hypothetical protein [Kriegella aquimaris]SDM89152.1 hypothetical protein SAMN04488514_116100 [Kriegella aquimaris]
MKLAKSICIFFFLFGTVQTGHAQFLKKLKNAVVGETQTVPTEKTSGLDQKFRNWNIGEVQIIAVSVFSNDLQKDRQNIGTIKANGSFDFQMPDSIKTWVPINVYGQDCENSEEAVIKNPGVKIAWNRMFVFQNGKHIGELMPADPVKAAYNLNQGGINNGTLGHFYLWIYADGNASATIDCYKKMDMTDGKSFSYKNMPVEDRFDLHYKKGWNIVQVENVDNIWVGLTQHYLEREWKVVNELPNNTTWVFRPMETTMTK